MNQSEDKKLLEYYRSAMELAETNPDAAVNNARKAAERICKDIINSAGKSFDQHATIESLLIQITSKGSKIAVDPKLILAIRTIQVYANYGAHDQSYQADEAIGHSADLSSEDIVPCMDALTQLLKTYIQGFIEDNNDSLPCVAGINYPEDFTLKIGATSLTVPDSIMQGWQSDELFSKLNIKTQRIPCKWNDQILSNIADNTLDMAIYNKESTLKFAETHPDSGIHILRDVCSSMGGRNFYILASDEGRWKDMTLQQFKDSLAPGVMIAVSKNSDMEKNLLYVLDKTGEELKETGVKLIDYHSDQGLNIFDFNPDILVIGGQDLRFLAEKKGGFTEVVSYDNLPVEKKEFFDKNAVNSLVVGSVFYDMFNKETLEAIVSQLMINFYSSNLSDKSRSAMRNKLRPQVRQICDDDETADYIIKRILFETYRFF